MKSKMMKRTIALLLCMVMVLSNGSYALADETITEEAAVEAVADDTVVTEEPAVEEPAPAPEVPVETPVETPTEAPVEEPTTPETEEVVPEETPAEESTEATSPEVETETSEETVTEKTEETTTEETEEVQTEETTEDATASEDNGSKVNGTILTTINTVLQILEYEDDEVKIHVEEAVDGAIPENASLKVTPITAKSDEEEYSKVETKLNEKAADEEYDIAGFLAYDITFIDAAGNEIEPNGNVKVTMEYKKAVVPETVDTAADLNVTVMHFEEDETGEVETIVDMVATKDIEAEVKLTENAEIEKAEFVTDSFSTYTVTWTYNRNGTEYEVILKPHYGYLNESGEFVEFGEPPTNRLSNITATQNDTIVNLGDYTNSDVFGTGDYSYDKAYIVKGDAAYSNAISATQLRLHYSSSINGVRLQYGNGNYNYTELFNVTSSTSDNNKVCSIYYVYKTPPKPITTVNSKAEYIKISISDYSIWTSTQKQWDHTVQYDINNGRALKFVTTGNQLSSPDYNVYTGGSTPRQGFINSNLASGYPKLTETNESLDYLFKSGYDANYLFKKVDGYYIYDSAQNFASLDTATGNFKVYSEPNKGFFPFNKFTEDLKIESASTSTVENHHSGMHVDFTFMQPKNGKTSDSADMIFEFSGDDDVWVFIDGVLVLDLGGIHQPTGGTINFATGDVTYTNATNTTIFNMYVEALKEQGMTDKQAREKAKTYFVEYETGKYRFKDYSQHDLDFFYLERGAHDSNCKIKFNLLSIPSNAVMIEKKITKSNMADFADAEFRFQIEKKDVNTDGTYPTESTILANTTYKLYEVDSAGNRTFVETRTTNAAGEFVLKHRQVAEFANIPASTKYCVTEVGVTSEVYDNVTVNGSNITIESTETEDGLTKHDYVTGDLLAQEHVYVTFENQCNVTNLRNLTITKEMADGQSSEESFNIKLEFAEGDSWIPYVGDYYLGSSTGDKKSTSDGIITLKPGQEAHVIGLISDTEYRVTEVLSENQKLNYGAPTYSGTGTVETIEGVTYIKDTIELNTTKDYMATVTNSLRMVVNVNKVWIDSMNSHESVYVGLYKQNGENWKPYSADSYKELQEGTWSTTFTGLDGGVYDVKELVPVKSEDDTSDFIINGTGYVATNDYYTYGTYDYAVSYAREVVQDTTNVTITNTRLGKIVIEKVSKSDNNLKLPNAEFKLQKYNVEKGIFEDCNRVGSTDTNGSLTFDNLEVGTYQIVETKAPTGYMLSADRVVVEIPKTNNALVTYDVDVTIENEALYELPSTGSIGIYWYMIAGVMLMMAAAAILYKNRRKEVLERVNIR